ncbi:UDP-glucuronate decarboxylase [Heracleum sosnowskyi]|uniref:UDP-glucuronate decarboxylase n=1 Tax=Heracleum sosnowskyi TaxID=360622 RepID=A0AAD8MSC1_9APIA|nr:UDP-glucuronate decarboxylase [Heracleum sosnowskyi]
MESDRLGRHRTGRRFSGSILSPIKYMLREQRMLFVLIGFAIPALVFNVFHVSSAIEHGISATDSLQSTALSHIPRRITYELRDPSLMNLGGKVPLGLKRKRLRVVVTGGAGFVGSHLVDRLLERGDSVIVVDNFFTGRKENLLHQLKNPRFELIRHDVVEPILLEVDQIYHLACPASPVHYKFNPVKTIISFLFHHNIFYDIRYSYSVAYFVVGVALTC